MFSLIKSEANKLFKAPLQQICIQPCISSQSSFSAIDSSTFQIHEYRQPSFLPTQAPEPFSGPPSFTHPYIPIAWEIIPYSFFHLLQFKLIALYVNTFVSLGHAKIVQFLTLLKTISMFLAISQNKFSTFESKNQTHKHFFLGLKASA